MKAETFFSESEKNKIAETVKKVERLTSGEVAVMVVDASDTYPEGLIIAGLVGGSLISAGIADYFFNASLWIFLIFFIVTALIFGLLVDFSPPIKRFFTPDIRMDIQVQDKALRAFYEKGLYKTREATGILFFISLFEHKVWVLADHGIYEKITREELQAYADRVALGIKNTKAADTLCSEIEKAGKILAEHFPIRPDDINELDNNVIIG